MNNGELALYEGYPLLDGSVSYHYPYSMLFYQGNSFESIFEVQYDYTNRSNGNEGLKMFYGDNSNTGSGMLPERHCFLIRMMCVCLRIPDMTV